MIKRLLVVAACLSLSLSSLPACIASENPCNIDGIKIYHLKSGQTVVIKEIHSNPIVTVDTWVNTGSINETAKNNGVSHFLEHLLFKGTKTYKAGEMDKILESKGAVFNAATSKDFTHFYITTASQYLDTAVKLDADMLLNATIPEDELKKERGVVQEEIRRTKDSPERILFTNLNNILFTHHPYKYDTIGTDELIGTIPRAEIINYYHKWYIPCNLTTVIVGDVDTQKALSMVEEHFKYDTKSDCKDLNVKYPREPEIAGATEKVEKGTYNTGYMIIGYKGVAITDKKDNYALDLAAAILGDGESSRLFQDIKENKQLANEISAGHESMKDDSIFYIAANFNLQNYSQLKTEIAKEVENLQNCLVSQEELTRAKTKFEREFMYSNESVENIANSIGYNMTIAKDINYYTKYLEEINKITAEDIQIAVKKYLNPNQMATSALLPKTIALNPIIKIQDKTQITKSAIKNQETFKNTTKSELCNGITLITEPNNYNDVVSMSVFVKGGGLLNQKPGLLSLIAETMMKGTTTKSALEISKELENSGIIISPSTTPDYFEIQLKTAVTDLDKALNILTDIIKNPTFNDEYIQKAKNDILESINQSRDVPSSLAYEKLLRTIYPNHPYGNVGEIIEKSLPSIKREDIVNSYKSYFVPENMVISVTGKIDAKTLADKFNKEFSSSAQDKIVDYKELEHKFEPLKGNMLTSSAKDSSAASMYMGWPASSISDDKDYASLKLISAILGNGMSSRLFVNLREKQSLAYEINSSYPSRIDNSIFMLYIGTAPKNTEIAFKGFLNEINKIKTQKVDEKELLDAKQKLIGQFALSQETNQQKAHNLGWFETINKGFKYNYKFPDIINSITSDDIINTANKYLNTPYAVSIAAPETSISGMEKEIKSESKR